MKFRNSLAILACSAAFLLVACGGNDGGSTPASEPAGDTSSPSVGKVTVTFDSKGGSSVAPQTIDKGAKVTKPANPTKLGAEFVRWCVDAPCTMEYDFNEAVLTDMTLYAEWTEGGTDSSGSTDTYMYFCESTWWYSPTTVTMMSIDGAGILDLNAQSFDVSALTQLEVLSTVRLTETDYISYYSFDSAILETASTIRFIRMGYKDGDKTKEIVSYGAYTVEINLSEKGDNNMYDLLGVGKPSAWEGGSDASVEGVWGKYNPNRELPWVPGGDSSSGGGQDTSGSTSGLTLYFKDVAWWAKDNARSGIYLWGEGDTKNANWPGEAMTSLGDGMWTYTIPEGSAYANLIFTRIGATDTVDWGAKTINLTIADINPEMPLYDISEATTETWGDPGVTGVWKAYNA